MLAVPSQSRSPPVFFPGLIPPNFCSVISRGSFCRRRRLPRRYWSCGLLRCQQRSGMMKPPEKMQQGDFGSSKAHSGLPAEERHLVRAAAKETFVWWVLPTDENDPNGFLFHCQLPMDLGLHIENPRARWLESRHLSPCGVACRRDEALAAQFLRELERSYLA